MESKEKEIEEMTHMVRGAVCNGKCSNCSKCCEYHTAEALYNAGYRKTFTSELASETQKAYKSGYLKGLENMGIRYGQLNEALRKNIQLEETIDNKDKLIDKLLNENIERVKEVSKLKTYNNKLSQGIYFGNGEQFSIAIEEAKQKVIKEFAGKIKNKMHDLDEGEASAYFLESDIDKLLKEFLNE